VSVIFHILGEGDWVGAQAAGAYAPPGLATEGFIHFSTRAQVLRSAGRFFAGRDDLVLLVVDEARVRAPVKYEPADGQLFPHVYGPLNLDAVIEAARLESHGDAFVLPVGV
jgi:uncharacterized protein (DUF952 family)